jgi:glycosyl transferase family 25
MMSSTELMGAVAGSCFERAFVINLDSRPDRWARMEANLAAVGIMAERFPAVGVADLGQDQPPQALRAFLRRVDGPRPTAEHKLQTTWACMRSHLAIIGHARQAGLASVLILEDDCEFEPYTSVVLQRMSKQLQQRPWDMCYLGGTLKKGGLRQAISANLLKVSRVRLAHAYMVSSSVYDRILDEAPASGLPIDWYYSEMLLPSISAYMVRPLLAQQRLLDISDIEQVERKPKLKTRQALQRWLAMLRYGRPDY